MRRAIEVPLEVMRRAAEAMEIIAAMAAEGLQSSVSDAGVGALMARAAVRGAHLNVRTNLAGFADEAYADEVLGEAARLVAESERREAEILEIAARRIG
jgi:glutamate formiminotransferase/formiminotetrahydrofolate cyclodeaminase